MEPSKERSATQRGRSASISRSNYAVPKSGLPGAKLPGANGLPSARKESENQRQLALVEKKRKKIILPSLPPLPASAQIKVLLPHELQGVSSQPENVSNRRTRQVGFSDADTSRARSRSTSQNLTHDEVDENPSDRNTASENPVAESNQPEKSKKRGAAKKFFAFMQDNLQDISDDSDVEELNKRQSRKVLTGRSFRILPGRHPVRVLASKIAFNPYFEMFVNISVLLNSFIIMIRYSLGDEYYSEKVAMEKAESALFSIFLAEFVLLSITHGLYAGKNAYLKEPSNIVSFLVIFATIVAYTSENERASSIRAIRIALLLRQTMRVKVKFSFRQNASIFKAILLVLFPSLFSLSSFMRLET